MLKSSLSFFLFCIASQLLIAQSIVFTDLADLPSARSAVSSAHDSDNIYVANGFGPGVAFSTEVYKYNTTNDEWSLLTDMTVPKRFGASALVNDKLYIFNGEMSGDEHNAQLEIIDVNTGAISFGAENPLPTRVGGVAVWEDKIYAFGGTLVTDNTTNAVYVYDPANDSWAMETEMPVSFQTKGEIVNGKLYIVGGYNGTASSAIYIYNIESKLWETPFMMSVGVSANATASLGNTIYISGDFTNQTYVASFNTEDSSFEILDGNLKARRHHASEGVGGRLYVIGGNTASSADSALSSMQASDILNTAGNITEEVRLALFPNPAVDEIQLSHALKDIKIYDIEGRILKSYRGLFDTVDVRSLVNGKYLLTGILDGQLVTLRWVKGV